MMISISIIMILSSSINIEQIEEHNSENDANK